MNAFVQTFLPAPRQPSHGAISLGTIAIVNPSLPPTLNPSRFPPGADVPGHMCACVCVRERVCTTPHPQTSATLLDVSLKQEEAAMIAPFSNRAGGNDFKPQPNDSIAINMRLTDISRTLKPGISNPRSPHSIPVSTNRSKKSSNHAKAAGVPKRQKVRLANGATRWAYKGEDAALARHHPSSPAPPPIHIHVTRMSTAFTSMSPWCAKERAHHWAHARMSAQGRLAVLLEPHPSLVHMGGVRQGTTQMQDLLRVHTESADAAGLAIRPSSKERSVYLPGGQAVTACPLPHHQGLADCLLEGPAGPNEAGQTHSLACPGLAVTKLASPPPAEPPYPNVPAVAAPPCRLQQTGGHLPCLPPAIPCGPLPHASATSLAPSCTARAAGLPATA